MTTNEELGQETTTEETTSSEEKAPTVEEQLEVVQKELTETKEKLEHTDKGLRTAHQTLTEKDKQLKKQTDLNSRLDDLDERLKILAAMQAEGIVSGSGSLEGITPEEKQGLLQRYEKIEQEQADKRKQTETKAQQDDYNRQADAVYERAKVAFKDDEEGLEKVEDLLANGRLDRAEKKTAKAEGASKSTKAETEEEIRKKAIDEGVRVEMEKRGMLSSDQSLPSGISSSWVEFERDYIAGKIPLEDYEKRARREGKI